jgi:hypothetical protein
MNTYFLSLLCQSQRIGGLRPYPFKNCIEKNARYKVYLFREAKKRFTFIFGLSNIQVENKEGRLKVDLSEEDFVSSFSFELCDIEEGITKLITRHNFRKRNLVLRWILILSS